MTHSQPEHRWEKHEAEWVAIDSLLPSDSPRLEGESGEHARALAASDAELPPILVHRATMRVIDGMHRLRAAILRGEDEILAVHFDGDDDDAFVLAVESNIAHGLPLSVADRAAAAVRIIATRPQWSDRRIAAVSGLAASTVGTLRRRSTDGNGQSNAVNAVARVGRDGRVRPFNSASGRMLASELIKNRPEASIREIASTAGVSPSTALDVRRRLRNGEHPVPRRQRVGRGAPGDRVPEAAPAPGRVSGATPESSTVDSEVVLRNLRNDPSLRLNDAGRALLRWLDSHSSGLADWEKYLDAIPAHSTRTIAELARYNAQAWEELAGRLERGGHPRQ